MSMKCLFFSASLVLFAMSLASCSFEQPANRYQLPAQPPARSAGAVAELQLSAIGALGRQDYDQAVDYLQRAIRIEPRDPFNWHYLAQAYWYRGDFERCLAMLERSIGYSSREDDLDQANADLRAQCQSG